MKNKIKFILIFILLIPIIVFAEAQVKQYFDATSDANNYINRYADRNKYLLLNNVKFKYENRSLSVDPTFTKGGLLNKEEYDLSVLNNKSYLMSGREYWTMTDSAAGSKYYIDTYAFSKPTTATSGARVTEQVKGSVRVTGRGTYANPWVFEEGYEVTVKPNNSTYAVITPTTQIVKSGAAANLNISIKQGYKYSGKDDCNLVKKASTTYEIRNVIKDISCVAIFEQVTYKFNLTSSKDYTTQPSPNPIYLRYGEGWYNNNMATSTKIIKITPPTITGYTFNGYKYGSTQVINSAGSILTSELPGFNYDLEEQDLEADITANQYTIKYNSNGGTGAAMAASSHTYDVAKKLTKNTYTKVGYTFIGWSTSSSATTATYTDEQSVSNLSSTNGATVTLYAVWDGNTYTATFNQNGATSIGKTTLSCKVANEAGTCNVTAPSITRDGFDKVGWSTSSSATTGTAAGGSLTLSNDANYYAITKKAVTITFNRNGNSSQTPSGGSASTAATVTSSCTIWNTATTCNVTSPAITHDGYTIIGYSTAAGTHTSSWNVSTTKAISSGGTYYAQASKALTVTFTLQDSNAATKSGGSTGCTLYNGDTSCSITAPKLTANSGYAVVGWNTNQNATTSTLASEGTGSISSNTTYYSIIKPITALITFDYQESLLYSSNKRHLNTYFYPDWSKDMKIVAKFKIPEQGHNYLIVGNYKDDSTDASSNLSIEVTNDNRLKLYAGQGKLERTTKKDSIPANKMITVTFTWTASESKYELTASGNDVSLSFSGKCVDKYCTSAPSGVAEKQLRTNCDNRSEVIFEAIQIGSLKITVPRSAIVGTLPAANKNGYTRDGWYTASSGGTKISSSQPVTGNATYYLRLIPHTYTVKYNKNGGSGTMENSSFTFDVIDNLRTNTFTKSGKSFQGWATESDGPVKYLDGASVRNLSATDNDTVNLYAVWGSKGSTSGWRLTCRYEIGGDNDPVTTWYGSEQACLNARSSYSGTWACSQCGR